MTLIQDLGDDLNNIKTEQQAIDAYEAATSDKVVALYSLPPQFAGLSVQTSPGSTYDYINTTQAQVRRKYITGTISTGCHAAVELHGLDDTKILAADAWIKNDCATSAWIRALQANVTSTANADNYVLFGVNGTQVYLTGMTLSGFVGKPFRIAIDYQV